MSLRFAAALIFIGFALLACRTSQSDVGSRDSGSRSSPDSRPAPGPARGRARTTAVKTRIVFFGDSITKAGVRPGGYVLLVRDKLKRHFPDRQIEVFASGVSGDTVEDLQRRLDRDVLSREPTHVVVYVGVNDVGQRRFSSQLAHEDEQLYRDGLVDLMSRIQQAGAQAILCTPAVFGDDPASDSNANKLLDAYAAISREVAVQTGARLCDLRADFTSYLLAHNSKRRYQGVVTVDGVHLNEQGNQLVSAQILKVLDLSEPADS